MALTQFSSIAVYYHGVLEATEIGSNQFYIKNHCFEPIYKPIKVAVDNFTL